MKQVLLLSNKVLHYRVKVYNDLAPILEEHGYALSVAGDSFQDDVNPIRFDCVKLESLKDWKAAIDAKKPEAVILFLHLKDGILFDVISYCKKHQIKVIYWNHGINIADPNNIVKNAAFHRVHSKCDALITYMPCMRKHFKKKNQHKLFIAPNTLSFSGIDRSQYDNHALRAKYGISQSFVVLFVARINQNRRLELLTEGLKEFPQIGLVVAGPGMSDDVLASVNSHENFYYFGERYGDEVCELFALADVFSVPGSAGLAVNEAMFWGLPFFMLSEGVHGPEKEYVVDRENGVVAKNENQLISELVGLSVDRERLGKMSESCKDTFAKEMSIGAMASGFIEALDYCFNS